MRWFVVCMVAACSSGGPAGKDVDTGDTAGSNCTVPAVPLLQFAQGLEKGPASDGAAFGVGIPIQGGAPYLPVEVRAKASLEVTERVPVVVDVWRLDDEVKLGTVSQPQAFVCSNTGVHRGWRYGGEVHARFDGLTYDDLDGVPVRVEVSVQTPEGLAEAEVEGVLSWTLSPVPGEE